MMRERGNFLAYPSKGPTMTHVDDEIASQPACWERAAELARRVELALPRRGQRVAVVGCGTSWFVAQAYAALREQAGHGWTDAFAASEMTAKDRSYDRVVAISRSGTTTEVVELLRRLKGTATTVLTAVAESPVTGEADESLVLGFADERSVVQTRFATTALTLLRAPLGESGPPIEQAREALAEPLPIDPAQVEQITFLGSGWAWGLAQEAALKCREAAGLWVEAYPGMEYRHGPIAIAQPGRAVWALGPLPEGLADDISKTGATLIQSTRDPLAELIRAQRFAIAAAKSRGLDPDTPRALTRSVVLP
jgi:fructoselysine-6-P-deglycase FrlB-like protein